MSAYNQQLTFRRTPYTDDRTAVIRTSYGVISSAIPPAGGASGLCQRLISGAFGIWPPVRGGRSRCVMYGRNYPSYK